MRAQSADGDFIVAYADERSFLVFDLRRSDDKPIRTLQDPEIRSATFDAHRRLLYVLSNVRLGMLPFGPQEVSDALEGRDRVMFCSKSGSGSSTSMSGSQRVVPKRASKIAANAKDKRDIVREPMRHTGPRGR
jgi:hypothetical protein